MTGSTRQANRHADHHANKQGKKLQPEPPKKRFFVSQ